MEIEIPELFDWIAKRSTFTAGLPFAAFKHSPTLFCQYRPPRVDSSFVSFSYSAALVKLSSQRTNEAREADESTRVTLGKLPPPKVCKVSKKKY